MYLRVIRESQAYIMPYAVVREKSTRTELTYQDHNLARAESSPDSVVTCLLDTVTGDFSRRYQTVSTNNLKQFS